MSFLFNRNSIKLLFLLLVIQQIASASNDSIVGDNPYLPGARFFQTVYGEPAARFWMPNPNQGVIEAIYQSENREKFHALQEGTSGHDFGLKAEGFTIKGKNAYWGNASYSNTQDKQVQWTDVSDIFRLGPYLIADSLGGDRYGEKYHFSGGFAVTSGKWTWGMEAAYRAGNEYRKRDPRPKTTVTDLSLKVGVAYPFGNYRAGVSFSGGTYRQDVSISVIEPNTNYAFFPMKGFGLYDIKQFQYASGFNWLYKGKSYGLDAFFLPQTGKGWIGKIGLNHENIDSYAGSNMYPFSFTTQTMTGEFGYKTGNERKQTQVKGDFFYQTGKGTERSYKKEYVNDVFTDYFLISESKKYTRNLLQAQLTGLQEWISPKNNKWIGTHAGVKTFEERYVAPIDGIHFNADYNYLTSGLNAGMEFFLKKQSSFLIEAACQYDALLKSDTQVPIVDKLFKESMQPNLEFMESNPWGGNLKLLYQFPVAKQVKMYLSAEGQALLADSNRSRYGIQLALGFRY